MGGCLIVVGHKSTEVIAHYLLLNERERDRWINFSIEEENATEIILLPATPGQPLFM